jgi:hypothetical protein
MSWRTAGVLALGVMLGTGLMTGMPASAAMRTAGPAVTTSTAHTNAVRITYQDKGATPGIVEGSCTSSRATWVHVDSGDGDLCFGYMGTAYFSPYPYLYEFCAGNNYGSFVEFNIYTGDYYDVHFKQGYGSDFYGEDIVSVTINGWSGNDKC